MNNLTLAQANLIADVTLEKGRELNLAPLTVAVLDGGGHLKVLKREDGASLLRPEIAVGKAWAVLGMGFGGREITRRAQRQPAFYGALSDLSSGRMVTAAGGVIIRDPEGEILGAVGVTGDTSDNDEICAVAGIVTAGLAADTGD